MGWHDTCDPTGFDMTFDDATRAQIDAARPDASTWLAANAGSGKTRVLTDRVARLLLDGVEPQHILCLTYTKAAASEMQNRLFKRLGEWAMRDNDGLREEMAKLGITGTLDQQQLRTARTLFALAIETPGGLKIQTIHSFCASLLRRFPLEAGVSPQFTEIEDRAADLLRADIVDAMADGSDAHLIEDIARFYTGEDFGKLTRTIVGKREGFRSALDLDGALDLFGQPAGLSAQQIENSVFLGSEAALFDEITPHLLAKGGNDEKAGKVLRDFNAFDFTGLSALEKVFLFQSGKTPFTAKIGSFPTKPTQKVIADVMHALEALMMRVEDARNARLSLMAAQKTRALHAFSRAFLARYDLAKERRGWLDFDDLILKARALLNDKQVAAWVLYRIDGGIDHILVDEAQDTSPRQWDVIEKLTDEFYSGAGARPDENRTLFVVGDKKQSIYSFQGADPLEFDRKAAMFEDKINDAAKLFQRRSLDYSFRSSSAILRLVDTAFDARLQPDFDKQTQHRAFKDMLPGRVDLWPVVDKAETEEDRPWTDPLDRKSAQHHTVILAERIARRIKELTEGEHYIPDDGAEPKTYVKRRILAGDFLILVQRRSPLFSEIIRACKAAGLPIAGADRLKVGAELAVKDLAALLSFLATPDDSLSLATALKSPLFGWDEQELFTLAHGRQHRELWQSLRVSKTHPDTLSILKDLRAQVDFLRPYDLIERILTRHGGRANLLARLGPEAEDGINAMLTQALSYERGDVPSLTGFIEWMQTDDLEIKRQIDSASNQIRVMTVHGAKGLEAPIVILPDTGKRDVVIKDEIVEIDATPVWKPAKDDMPQAISAVTDEMKSAQLAERLRLLYVAMTRAEKWLIVATAGDLSKDGNDWYQITSMAMSHINGVPDGTSGTLRFQEGEWDSVPTVEKAQIAPKIPELETVFAKAAPPYCVEDMHLSPSNLGGAKALQGELGEDKDAAMRYGSLVHDLIEKLGQTELPGRHAILEKYALQTDPEMLKRAQDEAINVIDDPTFSKLFGPDTFAEIPVTAQINGKPIYGIIDRMQITETDVLIVDFKTNRVVPKDANACPEGILRQMGAYAEMLRQIYPNHMIRTAVLWTATQQLMHLPHETVTKAINDTPYLDVVATRS
jgi:ATP-dependent helicase/nuclease subunit A